MAVDLVLIEKSKEIEEFGKKLGYEKIFFKDELKLLKIGKTRKDAERGCDILLNPHLNKEKDKIYYRSSGLNHVLCKLMREKETALGVSLNALSSSVDIGRVMQNIKLCLKYNVNIAVFSLAENKYQMKGYRDVFSLCNVLGLGNKSKKALNYIGEVIEKKKNKNKVSIKGVKIVKG